MNSDRPYPPARRPRRDDQATAEASYDAAWRAGGEAGHDSTADAAGQVAGSAADRHDEPAERIAALRSAIAEGRYESPARLAIAVERLAAELADRHA